MNPLILYKSNMPSKNLKDFSTSSKKEHIKIVSPQNFKSKLPYRFNRTVNSQCYNLNKSTKLQTSNFLQSKQLRSSPEKKLRKTLGTKTKNKKPSKSITRLKTEGTKLSAKFQQSLLNRDYKTNQNIQFKTVPRLQFFTRQNEHNSSLEMDLRQEIGPFTDRVQNPSEDQNDQLVKSLQPNSAVIETQTEIQQYQNKETQTNRCLKLITGTVMHIQKESEFSCAISTICTLGQNDKQLNNLTTVQCSQFCSQLLKVLNKIKIVKENLRAKEEKKKSVLERKTKSLINQRWCLQVGQAPEKPLGVATSLKAIADYLDSLFCYAQLKERKEILKNMSKIYGLSYPRRFRQLRRGQSPRLSSCQVISDQLFLSLQKELCEQQHFQSERQMETWCLHNQVIFNCVNQHLQEYKPFFLTKGEPYPWTISLLGCIYFAIDNQSLSTFFDEIKNKVIKTASFLLGMHIEHPSPQILIVGQFYQKCNQQRIQLCIAEQIWAVDDFVGIEQQLILTLILIAMEIERQIFQEVLNYFLCL